MVVRSPKHKEITTGITTQTEIGLSLVRFFARFFNAFTQNSVVFLGITRVSEA